MTATAAGPRRGSGRGRAPARTGAMLALLVALALAAAPLRGAEPLPDADRLVGWIRDLADPAMDGRRAGTPGADRAAAYVAAAFARAGLRPGGDDGGFLQRFEVVTGARVAADSALEATAAGVPLGPFSAGQAFAPLGFVEDGEATGEGAFAGYGITVPAVGYDDYAGVDVRGKVVLVMTGEPREGTPDRPFHAAAHRYVIDLRYKLLNARAHGARALLLVERPSRPDRLIALQPSSRISGGIVGATVGRAVADALLGPAGASLATLQARIDATGQPASSALAGVRVRVRTGVERLHAPTANVIGVLPGADPARATEAIVVGAHYDHLGHGGPTSLAPEAGDAIHPGADDNASGTAALIGLAEAFGRAGPRPRTVLFIAFGGEELGLLGSTHYVSHPAVPLARTVAMVNLDSVGRLQDGKLLAMGVDTGTGLRALVEREAAGLPLRLTLQGDGSGPSDHAAFLSREIPVLFFYTGPHGDYHRPSDTWDKINGPGLRTVATLTYRVVRELADATDRPAFARVTAPAGPARERHEHPEYGPFLGIVPEPGGAGAAGVRLTGVQAESPAARAGLRVGDVIVRFGDAAIRTLDDLAFALRSHQPGDRVAVRYLRDGAEHATEAILEGRP